MGHLRTAIPGVLGPKSLASFYQAFTVVLHCPGQEKTSKTTLELFTFLPRLYLQYLASLSSNSQELSTY